MEGVREGVREGGRDGGREGVREGRREDGRERKKVVGRERRHTQKTREGRISKGNINREWKLGRELGYRYVRGKGTRRGGGSYGEKIDSS